MQLYSSRSDSDRSGNLAPQTGTNSTGASTQSTQPTTATTTTLQQRLWDQFESKLPPPPEDSIVLIGDLAVLSIYALTSHSLNNWIVQGTLLAGATNIPQAVHSLDPTGDVLGNLAVPVWLEDASPHVLQNIWMVQAQDSLLDHYGPLFCTEGSSWVVLASAWLVAGYWGGAFLWKNSLDCETSRALIKTVQTWAIMLVLLAMSTLLVNQFLLPGHSVTWTKADVIFLIDSATVLIAWRYIVNSMMNMYL